MCRELCQGRCSLDLFWGQEHSWPGAGNAIDQEVKHPAKSRGERKSILQDLKSPNTLVNTDRKGWRRGTCSRPTPAHCASSGAVELEPHWWRAPASVRPETKGAKCCEKDKHPSSSLEAALFHRRSLAGLCFSVLSKETQVSC